jgi:hypothetical protein
MASSPIRRKTRNGIITSRMVPPDGVGWISLTVGLVTLALGAFVWGAAFDWYPGGASARSSPAFVLASVSLLFLLVGFLIFGQGLIQLREQRRREKVRRLEPGQPAMLDHPWDPVGSTHLRWASCFPPLFLFVLFFLFSVLAVWVAFATEDNPPYWVKVLACLTGLLTLGVAIPLARRIRQALRFYGGRLQWPVFPLPATGLLEFSWAYPGLLPECREASAILRWVEETQATSQGGQKKSAPVQSVLWEEKADLSFKRESTPPLSATEFSFQLPPDAGGTKLRHPSPAYFWELEIRLQTTSGRLVEIHLVPVYVIGK